MRWYTVLQVIHSWYYSTADIIVLQYYWWYTVLVYSAAYHQYITSMSDSLTVTSTSPVYHQYITWTRRQFGANWNTFCIRGWLPSVLVTVFLHWDSFSFWAKRLLIRLRVTVDLLQCSMCTTTGIHSWASLSLFSSMIHSEFPHSCCPSLWPLATKNTEKHGWKPGL